MAWHGLPVVLPLLYLCHPVAAVVSALAGETGRYGDCHGQACARWVEQAAYDPAWAHALREKVEAALQHAPAPCPTQEPHSAPQHRSCFAAAKALGRAVVHYQIWQGALFRQPECMFPARCAGVEHFLVDIAAHLPDMDLLINVGDPPLARWDSLPVFSFSKTEREHDIMYPAWTFWEGGPAVWPLYPQGLGRWDLKRNSVAAAAAAWPWAKKDGRAFFRGSRTSAERDPLVLLSRLNPELVDAAYVKNQAFKHPLDLLYAEEANLVSLEDHCRYRFLFNFRGVAASFRHKHLFLCRSLVFHVGEEWREFYYDALVPWVHYVPVSVDLREAQRLLTFFQQNGDLAEAVAENGRRFIEDQLTLDAVRGYWKELLLAYAPLLRDKPRLVPGYRQLAPAGSAHDAADL